MKKFLALLLALSMVFAIFRVTRLRFYVFSAVSAGFSVKNRAVCASASP